MINFNHTNIYINCEWLTHSNQKTETIGLDKNKTQLYAVYKKYSISFVCHYLQMLLWWKCNDLDRKDSYQSQERGISREGMRTELEKGNSTKSGMLYLKLGARGALWGGWQDPVPFVLHCFLYLCYFRDKEVLKKQSVANTDKN